MSSSKTAKPAAAAADMFDVIARQIVRRLFVSPPGPAVAWLLRKKFGPLMEIGKEIDEEFHNGPGRQATWGATSLARRLREALAKARGE